MAKLAYLEKEIKRLKRIKEGIAANSGDWTSTPNAASDLQTTIDALEAIDVAITATEVLLKQKRNDSKNDAKTASETADQSELVVMGKYPSDSDKWLEYGIETTGPRTPRPAPAKGLIKKISDDIDGEGFILEVARLENADKYEYQRGEGPANDVNTIPTLAFLRTVGKTKIVDDDVEPGIRYFYRYRGINPSGNGEWSEPVSRVQ